MRVALVLGALGGGCGDDPTIIFRVTSTTSGTKADIRACKPAACGMDCGDFATVLAAGEHSADGAVFDVPANITEVPIEVQQSGTSTMCNRTTVTLTKKPVELTIEVGASGPTISCPSCTPMVACPSACAAP